MRLMRYVMQRNKRLVFSGRREFEFQAFILRNMTCFVASFVAVNISYRISFHRFLCNLIILQELWSGCRYLIDEMRFKDDKKTLEERKDLEVPYIYIVLLIGNCFLLSIPSLWYIYTYKSVCIVCSTKCLWIMRVCVLNWSMCPTNFERLGQ